MSNAALRLGASNNDKPIWSITWATSCWASAAKQPIA
jgi:hypothetical protein